MPAHSAGDAAVWALDVSIRPSADGEEIAREPVTESDLAEIRSQVWFDEGLRGGAAAWAMEEVRLRLDPVFRPGSAVFCEAFAYEALLPDGRTARRVFGVESLRDVAMRAALRLRENGALSSSARIHFRLAARREPPRELVPPGGLTISVHRQPLVLLTVPIADVDRERRRVGPDGGGAYPVYYTEQALSRAERFARRGAERPSPVETGAVLLGPLCRCPETREVFAIATDALEVVDAEETAFSLSYSSRSWERIQAVLRTMQADPPRRAWRLLGQAHGHNFLPGDGAPPCEACASLPVCGRSTVFASESDRAWMRAVFSRQPWQLCHIFGLNARKEGVGGLFGLRDGRLEERGFHAIPSFDPGARAIESSIAERS